MFVYTSPQIHVQLIHQGYHFTKALKQNVQLRNYLGSYSISNS